MDLSLNGTWLFFIDEIEQGLVDKWYSRAWITANAQSATSIEVPSNFNTLPGLMRYAGTVWYFTKIPQLPFYPTSHDYYFEFDGVNYITDAWINGRKIGHHEGGFLPFRFDFDPHLLSMKSDNWIAVRVNASLYTDGIPRDNEDWFNWGGIHRNVQIVILETTRIRDIKIYSKFFERKPTSATIYINYMIKNFDTYLERCLLNGEEPRVEYELYFLGRFVNGNPESSKVLIQTGYRPVGTRLEKDIPLEPIPHDIEAVETYFKDLTQENEDWEGNLERFFLDQKESSSEQPEEAKETKENSRAETTLKFKNLFNFPPKQQLAVQKRSIRKIRTEGGAFFALMDHFEIMIQSPALWTPDTPDLYEITLQLRGVDEDKTKRFGIRTISAKGVYLFLNNSPIRLKGVNIHEEQNPYGRHYPNEQRRSEIQTIKKLGLNAIRTAHYSHDKDFVRIADEEGIMILEEIPLYWNCEFQNPKVVKLASHMLYDLINRDFNHPSVIIWSVGNEVPTERWACAQEMPLLMQWVRKIDPTRLVTYVSARMNSDTVRRAGDVNCVNMYFGWYYLTPYQLNFFLDATHFTNSHSPWIMTEFGADAKIGIRDPEVKYSEDNQARIIAHTIRVLNSKPYIAGWFIWVYRDFLSPLRQKQYQQGFNRKGLVDDQNQPKLIFKALPRLVNQKLTKIRHYRALAHLFSYITRWIEMFFMGIGNSIIYSVQEKIVRQYYAITKKSNSKKTK